MYNLGFLFMDITLTRILSLIPKKEDGSFKHGAKAEFGRNLGYDGGEIINMWEKGTSTSYMKKLHEISSKYNVSLEWLRGETDEKSSPVHSDERALDEDLISRLTSLTPEELQKVDAFVQGLLANR